MSFRLTPLYAFNDPAEYHRRHSAGVLKEFENESREVNAFNAKSTQFKAWILANLYRGRDKSYWVFIVRPGESGADFLFPREGESCEILLWSKAGKVQKSHKYWEAERIENPAASFGVIQEEALRMPAFKVKVPGNVPEDLLRPLQDDPDEVGYNAPNRLAKRHALGDKKAVRITMKLRLSSATKDAEFGAIEKLFKNPDDVLTSKQKAAFKYLLDFKNVPFTVNLFQHFPHLRDPINNPGGMPPKVVTMLKGFNLHQQVAYKTVLSSLPCGICIIPGGPGAGKTHWNLVVTAAIQSKNIIHHGPDSFSNRSAKVLYILDINKPLDDTCNKIVRLYKSLGLKKHAVRMYGWPFSRQRGATIDFSDKFMFMARMNRFRRQTFNESCLAPTLDELVWDKYQAGKSGRYRALHEAVSAALKGKKNANDEALRELTGQLYHDVLDQIDFIATTPVPAATRFNCLFKPDIVIFDESPHAREASTMIAIAQYEPIAWIFSGDHRQTRPFVASDDVRDNPWAPQMLISMMERADRRGAIRHSLLINHRGYGGLQQLASRLFYERKMISGHKDEELFPPSVSHIQRYLERFLDPGRRCGEPRLLAFNGSRSESRVGTSWFNQRHIDWVMQRVSELLPDPMFRQAGKDARGTILIISPYKESYMKYKRAIKSLPASWQTRLNVEGRVEARTIDTVQGGEADFVFLDFVRSESSSFTDDPNRLNVALTRARQGEIIMMHPDMRRYSQYLSQVFNHCEAMGQVVEINKQAPRPISSAANERESYQKHVAFQRQFDNERVAYGLQPKMEDVPSSRSNPAQVGENPLDEDNALESIFTAQIAGLASMMERILAEKRANDSSRSVQEAGVHRTLHSNAPDPPGSAIEQGCGRGHARPREANSSLKRAASQIPVETPTMGRAPTSIPFTIGSSAALGPSQKETGLMQSQWTVPSRSAPAVTVPSDHKGEDLDQDSPNMDKSSRVGHQDTPLRTTIPTAAQSVAAQDSSRRCTRAHVDEVNGIQQPDTAESVPKTSTASYWW